MITDHSDTKNSSEVPFAFWPLFIQLAGDIGTISYMARYVFYNRMNTKKWPKKKNNISHGAT